MGNHMKLLVKRGDWDTVAYVSKLKRNAYTDYYFKCYEEDPRCDGTMRWNYKLAIKLVQDDLKAKKKGKRVPKKASSGKIRKTGKSKLASNMKVIIHENGAQIYLKRG